MTKPKSRKRSVKRAVWVTDPSTGKRQWWSIVPRTEAQALRMKHHAPLPAPPSRALPVSREEAGSAALAEVARKRRESPMRYSLPRAARKRVAHEARVRDRAAEIHAELARGNPVPNRRPVGFLRAAVGFLTGGDFGDEDVEPEARALAQAQLAREKAAERAADQAAVEEAAARPWVGLDRILVAADAAAAEVDYQAEVAWDYRHPERRKRWSERWMEETPRTAPQMVISSKRTEWQDVPVGYGRVVRRPVLVYTEEPAPWEPRTEDRAAAAYDAALRSGEVARWWAPIRQAEEDRKAAWLSRMARKHPDADPSHYGILAQRDARREEEERDAARLLGYTAHREREEKERLAEEEKAVREKYGIPEGVPVFPPKTAPEPAPATTPAAGTEAPKPPTPAPPTGGRVSAVSGIGNAGVYPPINPPPLAPPGTEEPPKAVPKASPNAPSGGVGAVRGPTDGSAPPSLPPSFQERRAGRPRLYEFDPSEARRLRSLGFPTAEIVRMLGLPDTESARRLVRAAVRE